MKELQNFLIISGWTQNELARKLKVDKGQMSRWMNGQEPQALRVKDLKSKLRQLKRAFALDNKIE